MFIGSEFLDKLEGGTVAGQLYVFADKIRKCENMEMVFSCFEKYKGLVLLFIPTHIA